MIHPPPPRHSRMTSTLAQMGMGLGSVSTAAAVGAVGSGSAVTGMGGASVSAGDGSSGTSSLMVVLQVFGESPALRAAAKREFENGAPLFNCRPGGGGGC